MLRWILHAIQARLELANKTIPNPEGMLLFEGRKRKSTKTMIIIIITSFVSNFRENYFITFWSKMAERFNLQSWSVTKYLRKLQHARCVFRVVSRVSQLPSNFIITPGNVASPPTFHPRTSFRSRFPPRGGGVFNYYYGNLNHPPNGGPYTAAWHYLLAIISLTETAGTPCGPPRVSPI